MTDNQTTQTPEERAKKVLALAMQVEMGEVPEAPSVENWDLWDSLAHMRLILQMEKELGRNLPPEAVVEIATLKDVVGYMSR